MHCFFQYIIDFFCVCGTIYMVMIMIGTYSKQSQLENDYIRARKKTISKEYKTHCHEFFELEYILSGSGEYMVNGEKKEIIPGNFFFMTPADFHSIKPNNVELFNIVFSGDICNSAFLSVCIERAAGGSFEPLKADRQFYETIFSELAKNSQNIKYAAALLDCVLAKINCSLEPDRAISFSTQKKAELYILNNFKNNITLGMVAEHVNLTPSYFSAMFKEKKQVSFKDYISRLKMEYASKLVKFSDMTMMEICIESGFNDYANFERRFKKIYGQSPVEMRKSLKI